MKIIEYISNIFKAAHNEVAGFKHNPKFDMFLLMDSVNCVPEFTKASNGLSYIYFESMDASALELVRQMGFTPCLHKSKMYVPAKNIYRVHISRRMPQHTRDIIHELHNQHKEGMYLVYDKISDAKASKEYINYISNYNIVSQQITK